MKTIEPNGFTANICKIRVVSLIIAIFNKAGLNWVAPPLLLLFMNASVFAEGNIGSVTRIHGQVTLLSVAGSNQVAKGSEVHMGDSIATGDGSLVELTMQDQTKVTLGPKSELVLSTYIYIPAQSGRGILGIKKGVFRVISGSIASFNHQSLIINTPHAVISISEAEFWGKLSDQKLDIIFLGGEGISVGNSVGSVELNVPNTGTSISSSSAPVAPVSSTGSQLSTANSSISWP